MKPRPWLDALLRMDRQWCVASNRWGSRQLVCAYFSAISRLGDGAFWYVLMGCAVLLDGADGLRASVHMALAGLLALLLYRHLKRWTRRARPFAADRHVHALVAPLDEFSFPSGHTLHATAFTVVALAHYPVLLPVLVPFTASVAVSRVVLGLHFPSDVLAAAAIGSSIGAGVLWMGSVAF